jgi:alpha-N-arabinofuranosidase
MKLVNSLRLALCALVLPLAFVRAATLDVKVDATRRGAPISPYVYGQFIEHLGRCIYGGIWAEMLEDRKFYFPVTAEYAPYRSLKETAYPVVGASPWQIIGAAEGVAMVKEGALVGDQSPRVRANSGLRQRDLAVVAGRGYTGYVWARPVGGDAELEVALVWGDAPDARVARTLKFSGDEYRKQPVEFTAAAANDHASLEIRVLRGEVLLGPPSLMPADNVKGMRRDTLALLKQLNGSVYRWPGGNFVSGYDWRDGIGDRDRRPPRKNPAWTGVEHNDFGTDEFIAFCREIGTEPMIAANTGFGDAYSAAQWVEYCNAGADTIGGGWRVKGGHAAPYAVKFWCVGNEMFGPWQLGYMQLNHYTLKHNWVASAMWKVDPTLKLSGVGDLDTVPVTTDPDRPAEKVPWSQGMLEHCADYMTLISEHFYNGRLPWNKDPRAELTAHVRMLKDSIRKKADGHRKLQASLANLHGRIVPISMDEWNYWHREYTYGELGCVYDLADGLGVAEGLHEYFRQSDLIHMAFYAQTVNVIGAIKTSKTMAEMETTGLVLQMYRAHYGQTPLTVTEPAAPYDVTAALGAGEKTLTLGVVNPTKEELVLNLQLSGATVSTSGKRWCVTGADEQQHNTPGQPRAIDIQQAEAAPTALKVPALSATVFELPLK